MLIDDVIIKVAGGHGGKGAVAFSKTMMTLGPTGGSGGKGGDVYLEAVADLGALRRFRSQKRFEANDGRDGRGSFCDGNGGADTILLVPRGTVVHNLITKIDQELTAIGKRLVVATGGKGGRGNCTYKSSLNTSPKFAQPGLSGDASMLWLELKLIADIGLIGLPNIGKSSFLNAVTKAQSRVANYLFTTLEPNLGAFGNLILADIPGLIEGASAGRGLGIKFLRHIERTKVLFHFIDAGTADPEKDYQTIRHELGAYNPALLGKKEYLIISRTDLVDAARLAEVKKILIHHKKEIIAISIQNKESIIAACKILGRIAKDLTMNNRPASLSEMS